MKARHVLVVGAALAALAGCSTGSATAVTPGELDDAATFACTDFAKGYRGATTQAARLDLAHSVNRWARSSKTDRIATSGGALSRGVSSVDAWQLGADAFAQTCMDAGWDATKAS